MAAEWRPLRDDAHPHVRCYLIDLPPGHRALLARRGDKAVIFVNALLEPEARLAAYLHEVEHLDRGGAGWRPDLPKPLYAALEREEGRVEDAVADELLPPEQLALFVDGRCRAELPTTCMDVVGEFEVPEPVARRQLERLRRKAS